MGSEGAGSCGRGAAADSLVAPHEVYGVLRAPTPAQWCPWRRSGRDTGPGPGPPRPFSSRRQGQSTRAASRAFPSVPRAARAPFVLDDAERASGLRVVDEEKAEAMQLEDLDHPEVIRPHLPHARLRARLARGGAGLPRKWPAPPTARRPCPRRGTPGTWRGPLCRAPLPPRAGAAPRCGGGWDALCLFSLQPPHSLPSISHF